MITKKMTSLLLAGLLCTASIASYAADDSADATGTKSGGVSGSTLPPNPTPGAPSGGKIKTDNGTQGSGTGVNGSEGGASGSGAGGGTGAAGGGTGGAGGGTGS